MTLLLFRCSTVPQVLDSGSPGLISPPRSSQNESTPPSSCLFGSALSTLIDLCCLRSSEELLLRLRTGFSAVVVSNGHGTIPSKHSILLVSNNSRHNEMCCCKAA